MIDFTEKCRNRLISFARAVYPGFEDPPHVRKVGDELESVERGDTRRLIITIPPRHSKSLFASQIFPAYYLGKHPRDKVLLASNTHMLAADFGRNCRNIMQSDEYKLIFPDTSVSDDSRAKNSFKTTQGGEAFFLGIGGTIVGRGCFVAGTMVETEQGPIDIATLHSMKNPPRVLSFDHKTGTIVLKIIQVSREKFVDTLCESTVNDIHIVSTPDHKFYSVNHNEYRPVEELLNEKVYTYSPANMQFLRYRIYKISQGLSKEHSPGACGQLLQSAMFTKSSCYKKSPQMRTVQITSSQKNTSILRSLSTSQKNRTAAHERGMFNLSNSLYNVKLQKDFLYKTVCRQSALSTYDWCRQFALQNWQKLCKMVRRNEAADLRAGRSKMPSMFGSTNIYTWKVERWTHSYQKQFSNSSYRPQSRQQHSKQSGHTMPKLSYDTSPLKVDTISKLRIYSVNQVPVYDLQVEGTNNFFANKILVHNCHLALVDDPVKNTEEADSETYIKRLHSWYREVLYTRQMPGGKIIIIMQRWRANDLIGWLLDPKEQEQIEDWKIINFPAIATEDSDWRKTGDALWPERYPLDELEKIRIAIGSRSFTGMYQQQPSIEEGDIIQRAWLPEEKIDEAELRSARVMFVDTAFKDKTQNDYSAAVIGQLYKAANVAIMYAEQRKLQFPALVQWIKTLGTEHGLKAILVEDKASGPSLVQTLNQCINDPKDPFKIPVILVPIKKNEDKISRVNAITPFLESKRVIIHKWSPAHLREELINNLLQFPNASHDDLADAFTGLVTYLLRNSKRLDRLAGKRTVRPVRSIYDR